MQRVVREPLPAPAPVAPAAQPQTFDVVDLCAEDDSALDALVAAVDVEAIEREAQEKAQRASTHTSPPPAPSGLSVSPSKGAGSPSKGTTTPTPTPTRAPAPGSPPSDPAATTPGGSLRRSASYWQYKNREGPRALGTVEIPEVLVKNFIANYMYIYKITL